MAVLSNRTDQFSVLFSVVGLVESDWVRIEMGIQHYLEQTNSISSWIEAHIDLHLTDAKAFQEILLARDRTRGNPLQWTFEPLVEPSFQICTRQLGSVWEVSFFVDIKRLVSMNEPTAYRENEIGVRFQTDDQRLERFGDGLGSELSGILHAGVRMN